MSKKGRIWLNNAQIFGINYPIIKDANMLLNYETGSEFEA